MKIPAAAGIFCIGGEAFLLLVQGEVDSNGYRNGSTYHRVVTHTQEAHHLYVSRY